MMLSQIYARSGTPFDTREQSVQAMRMLMGAAAVPKDEPSSSSSVLNSSSSSSSNDNQDGSGDMNTETVSTETTNRTKQTDHHRCSSSSSRSQRPPILNVHGKGLLLVSDIPESARPQQTTLGAGAGVCVGIDEAGRGSVLGPMIYGAAFWNASLEDDDDDNNNSNGKNSSASSKKIPKGFHDSKQLTEETRADLLEQLMACQDIGWCTRVFEASEISRNMLRAGMPYNLNQMSHDAAMAMVQAIQDAGVLIQTCYIDTVGNPEFYRLKLERRFPDLQFVVESKADAKYASCSAASVVAKVVRDRMMEHWQFTEPLLLHDGSSPVISRDFGSGYPSDPKCKAWMANNLQDPVFGWPDIVRFSWGPAKKMLLSEAALVKFEADDEEEDNHFNMMMDATALAGRKRQQDQMSAFLKRGKKDRRLPYFERNNLQVVSNLF